MNGWLLPVVPGIVFGMNRRKRLRYSVKMSDTCFSIKKTRWAVQWNKIHFFWGGTRVLTSVFVNYFRTMEIYRKPMAVFNRVDRYCRRLFPLAFLMANLVYWYGYTNWWRETVHTISHKERPKKVWIEKSALNWRSRRLNLETSANRLHLLVKRTKD